MPRWRIALALALALAGCAAAPTWAQMGQDEDGGDSDGATAEATEAPARLDAAGLRDLLRTEMRRLRALGGADRHAQGDLYHRYAPSEAGAVLVIAHEGTGAYDPLVAAALGNLLPAHAGTLEDGLERRLYGIARGVAKRLTGQDRKWSGLMAGPMKLLWSQPQLLNAKVDWFSFPSEELEALAGIESLTFENLRRIPTDAARSIGVVPRGITRALAATRRYLSAAQVMGYTPKILVLTHSSGGRAAVKFMEYLRRLAHPATGRAPVEVDLVFTLDPVREAHEAVGEVIPQILGAPARLARSTWDDDVVVESKVWHRRQPESLYKTANARRWVSVYQLADTEGLKMQPRFGIQGSPIVGADHEERISGVGTAGHGEICYAERTLELLAAELRSLRAP